VDRFGIGDQVEPAGKSIGPLPGRSSGSSPTNARGAVMKAKGFEPPAPR
jgi:hypothetical protein